MILRLLLFTLIVSSLLLSGCGGGSSGPVSRGLVLAVSVDGISGDLQPSPLNAPVSSFSNGRIRITFDGTVDPSTLPADGPAVGSISVLQEGTGTPALGVWSTEGTRGEIAVFTPLGTAPGAGPCAIGFFSASTYTIEIAGAPPGVFADVVRIQGVPVSEEFQTRFATAACDDTDTNFADLNPGSPLLIPNTPPALGEGMPAVELASLDGPGGRSQIVVEFSEPLAIDSLSAPNAVRLIDQTASGGFGAPSPLFSSVYSPGAGNGISNPHLVITTVSRLIDGHVYDLLFTGVEDLNGDPLPGITGLYRFMIADLDDGKAVTITEDFLDSSRFAEGVPSSLVAWEGDGSVRGLFPEDIQGTGALGALTITLPLSVNTEDFSLGGQTVTDGVFNFTTLVVNPNDLNEFTLSFSSPSNELPSTHRRGVDIRTTDSISIGDFTRIDASGREGVSQTGPGNAGTISHAGGAGGPGAGRGGAGSPINSGLASPSGERGFGANIASGDPASPGINDNADPGSPFFGGGSPGLLGISPATSLNASGGGGASSSSFDGDFSALIPTPPFTWTATFAEAGASQSGETGPAGGAAGPLPAAFVTPLETAVAGSGGGAGGDRFLTSNPAFMTPGAGAGGGGGALQISSRGPIDLGDLVLWDVRGGDGGGIAVPGVGAAGGGSGGSVLLQTYDHITLGSATVFAARGGLGGVLSPTVPLGEGGRGGSGVVQLEDADPAALLTSLTNSIVQGELVVRSSGGADGGLRPLAFSTPFDTGTTATRFLQASATINDGPVGSASVFLRGIAEDPSQPGQPATTMTSPDGFTLMSERVALDDVSSLNGFRYFRIEVQFDYPLPPALMETDILPSVSEVVVTYEN